jgi:phosphate starvation-inducible PhoH-like protein
VEAERVLRRVPGIAMCHMTSQDVVRHPLVARIVDAYDAQGRSARMADTGAVDKEEAANASTQADVARPRARKKTI